MTRFLVSWLLSAAVMFGLFFWWHGSFLNDFAKLNYPTSTFLPLAAVTYMVIALVLYGLIAYLNLNLKNRPKGFLVGGVLGFFIYLVAFTLGVSFQSSVQVTHLAFDFIWQMAEQGVGGFVCGFAYGFFSVRIEHAQMSKPKKAKSEATAQ